LCEIVRRPKIKAQIVFQLREMRALSLAGAKARERWRTQVLVSNENKNREIEVESERGEMATSSFQES